MKSKASVKDFKYHGSQERREVELRKLFSLSIENEPPEYLRRIAATRQLETGDKSSVTSIINEAVREFLGRC